MRANRTNNCRSRDFADIVTSCTVPRETFTFIGALPPGGGGALRYHNNMISYYCHTANIVIIIIIITTRSFARSIIRKHTTRVCVITTTTTIILCQTLGPHVGTSVRGHDSYCNVTTSIRKLISETGVTVVLL